MMILLHIIIIIMWWSTILRANIDPCDFVLVYKGTQDPLSFPTSPARPGKNPKSSTS